MLSRAVFALCVCVHLVLSRQCYWNDQCSYQMFATTTPYDTVRGDIRDYAVPKNCQAVSIWSLNRHGNRNPGDDVTEAAKVTAGLKDSIVASFRAGTSQLCAQDIENLAKWKWNDTLDISHSYLTGVGYDELFNIAKRIQGKYPHLLQGTTEDYYFRPTNEQRTVTSAVAFVHGLSFNTTLKLKVDGPRYKGDEVIRPYEMCQKYQVEVKDGPKQTAEMKAYYNSQEFVTVQKNVQRRLGISSQLSSDGIYSIYALCRFYRTWESNLKSPWCSAFSDEDLVVLEYSDDVRHYYRNGYGSQVNVKLGNTALKDLLVSLEASVRGEGKRITGYFTHDTMIEMTMSAMGLFKDDFELKGSKRNSLRKWKTSETACFASNIMAVLNRCEDNGKQTNRVQLFVNEKPTALCPLEGCVWEQFKYKFERSLTANLSFCEITEHAGLKGGSSALGTNSTAFTTAILSIFFLFMC